MTHKSRSCKEEKITSSRGAKTRTSDLPFLRYDTLPLIYREPVGALDQLLYNQRPAQFWNQQSLQRHGLKKIYKQVEA